MRSIKGADAAHFDTQLELSRATRQTVLQE